jgi:hypothetical protein
MVVAKAADILVAQEIQEALVLQVEQVDLAVAAPTVRVLFRVLLAKETHRE